MSRARTSVGGGRMRSEMPLAISCQRQTPNANDRPEIIVVRRAVRLAAAIAVIGQTTEAYVYRQVGVPDASSPSPD